MERTSVLAPRPSRITAKRSTDMAFVSLYSPSPVVCGGPEWSFFFSTVVHRPYSFSFLVSPSRGLSSSGLLFWCVQVSDLRSFFLP